MLQINGKTFMNLQEAVQWLLDNNALPFQSSANYIANTEIGMGTIVNPSPAKVRIGSLIFFADSKVSTVIGLTENGFICSDQYNDLVDDVVYVSNVALNASGHLIVTLSNGTQIDAGLIKQVSGFSINGSQHLIVSFNDGTSTDLGAIFQGNINISGTLNATQVTGDEIVENMTGYSCTMGTEANIVKTEVYHGVVKNGNKITFCCAIKVKRTASLGGIAYVSLGNFGIPSAVGSKLFPVSISGIDFLDIKTVRLTSDANFISYVEKPCYTQKLGGVNVTMTVIINDDLDLNTDYYLRYEVTFLLSDPLI